MEVPHDTVSGTPASCEACVSLKKRLHALKKQLLKGVNSEHVEVLDEVCELLGLKTDGVEMTVAATSAMGHVCCEGGRGKRMQKRNLGIQVDRSQIEDTSTLVYDSEDERQALMGVIVDTARSSTVSSWLFSDMERQQGLGKGVIGEFLQSKLAQSDLARRLSEERTSQPPGGGGHSSAGAGGQAPGQRPSRQLMNRRGGQEITLPRFGDGERAYSVHKVRGMIVAGMTDDEICIKLASMPGTPLMDKREIGELRIAVSKSNVEPGSSDDGAYSSGRSGDGEGEDEPSRNHVAGPTYRVTVGDPFVPIDAKTGQVRLLGSGSYNSDVDADGSESEAGSPVKGADSMVLAAEVFSSANHQHSIAEGHELEVSRNDTEWRSPLQDVGEGANTKALVPRALAMFSGDESAESEVIM